jgi:outer membrane murein-binding lipoprotein Lpp
MIISDISNSELGAWVYGLATIIQIASTIAILLTINSKQKREVTFAGEPVDRKEFDKHVAENTLIHNQLFAKIGGAERGLESRLATRMDKFETETEQSRRLMHQDINAIGNDVAALKKEAELANQRAFQMDTKIDRLIERNQD